MNNGLKGYHPIVNFIFFISVVVFGMLFRHPVTLAVGLCAPLGYYVVLCKRAALKTFFAFLFPMLLLVLVMNGLFSHYGITPLLTLPDGNQMTLESLVYGFVLGLMTVSVILWFFCFQEVVTTDKFLYLFGKFLPALALVLSMALRFVPFYRRRLRHISQAQKGIGMDAQTGNPISRMKKGGKILSILLTWSLENAVETGDAMRARGYGLKGRTNYAIFRWRPKDTAATFIMLLLDGILILGLLKKSLACVYNPYVVLHPSVDFSTIYFIEELNLTINPISPLGVVTLFAFTALCVLPLWMQGKEALHWHRLRSKI